MFFGILEALTIFVCVSGIGIRVRPAEMHTRWCAVIHPCWSPDEVANGSAGQFGHLRNDLDARRPVANDRYPFVRIVEIVIPACTMSEMTFEVAKAGDIGPILMTMWSV